MKNFKTFKMLSFVLLGALSLQACRIQSGMTSPKAAPSETPADSSEDLSSEDTFDEGLTPKAKATADSLLSETEEFQIKVLKEKVRIPFKTEKGDKTFVYALDGKLYQADGVDTILEIETNTRLSKEDFNQRFDASICRGKWQPVRDEDYYSLRSSRSSEDYLSFERGTLFTLRYQKAGILEGGVQDGIKSNSLQFICTDRKQLSLTLQDLVRTLGTENISLEL